MPQRRPLPEHLAHIPFDRAALEAAQVTLGRLRDRDIIRAYHGVQSVTAPTTVLERCRAYRVRMRPGQFFSHVTAAQLLRFPMPAELEDRATIDVSAVMPAMAPRTRGVIGHRLRRPPATVLHRGLPITSAPETWCQLVAVLDDMALVVVADHVLGLWPARPDRALEVMRETAALAGRTGGARLLAALEEARTGSRSPGETRVRLLLTRAGLPEPVLNIARFDASGEFLGTPDLAWPARLVALEYEGAHHFTDEEQYRYDVQRYERFRDAGWTVVRAIGDDLVGAPAAALVARMRRLLLGGSASLAV